MALTDVEGKMCRLCNEHKSYSSFPRRPAMSDGYRNECKPCINAKYREAARSHTAKYRKNNPAKAGEYYQKNKEAIRAAQRERYKSSREHELERSAKWYAENKERRLAKCREWQKNNAGKCRAYIAKYGAAKRKRTVAWANSFLIELQYKMAAAMTRISGIKYEVDHIIPLQGENVSGLHVHNNLQVITETENRSKSNKFSGGALSH